jgi:hypothetical protein
MSYLAIPCQCGWPSCKSWQVRGVAPEAKFSKEQAEAVAQLLNYMDAGGVPSFEITTVVSEEKKS